MITARQTRSSIERSITGIRLDEGRLVERIRAATEEVGRLRGRQSEQFQALARCRLDTLARDQVVGQLDADERRALAALEQRRVALEAAAEKRAVLVAKVEAADATRDEAAAKLEAAIDTVEDLVESAKARVQAEQNWGELSRQIAAAQAKAVAAEEKASQSEADREEKRKPYDNDPLFSYLWKRGFGTAAYRAFALVRYFDAKVARIVDYDAARPNYHMLQEIPHRLREHADRMKISATETAARREAFERSELEADGIVVLEAAVDTAGTELEEAEAGLESLKAELAVVDQDHAVLLDDRADASLRRALDEFAAALARDGLDTLYREALQSPTPDDERIVEALRELEPTLARAASEVESARLEAGQLAQRRAELEESRERFRRSQYNDPGGTFDSGETIGEMLAGVARGVATSGALDQLLRATFRPRSPRSGGTFGGGWRRPTRASRPTPPMSGGGFKTGGSF